jgi:hypothetical protein
MGEPGQTGTLDKLDAKLFAESVELFAAAARSYSCQTKRGVSSKAEPGQTGIQDKRGAMLLTESDELLAKFLPSQDLCGVPTLSTH